MTVCPQCGQPVETHCKFWDDMTPRGSWDRHACQSLKNFDAIRQFMTQNQSPRDAR